LYCPWGTFYLTSISNASGNLLCEMNVINNRFSVVLDYKLFDFLSGLPFIDEDDLINLQLRIFLLSKVQVHLPLPNVGSEGTLDLEPEFLRCQLLILIPLKETIRLKPKGRYTYGLYLNHHVLAVKEHDPITVTGNHQFLIIKRNFLVAVVHSSTYRTCWQHPVLPLGVTVLALPHPVQDAHFLKPPLILGMDAVPVIEHVLKLERRGPPLVVRRNSLDAVVIMPSTPR